MYVYERISLRSSPSKLYGSRNNSFPLFWHGARSCDLANSRCPLLLLLLTASARVIGREKELPNKLFSQSSLPFLVPFSAFLK